jgi:hypothetical protein
MRFSMRRAARRDDDKSIRGQLEQMANDAQVKELTTPTSCGNNLGSPVLIRLADVTPEPVKWLWLGRIALGKETMIAGDPGLGKSFNTGTSQLVAIKFSVKHRSTGHPIASRPKQAAERCPSTDPFGSGLIP